MTSLALVYLARGADADHSLRFKQFLDSYRTFAPGIDHKLFIIFKGFSSSESQRSALDLFSCLKYNLIMTPDNVYDLGSYAIAAEQMTEDYVCFLNTNSTIIADDWLAKLYLNVRQPLVGAVAATGSYESLAGVSTSFPLFPNPHLRSNAILMTRANAVDILRSIPITCKEDAYALESGPNGITQCIFEMGLTCLVVGRDCRGYSPQYWPASKTFRHSGQQNLLVHDNVTRAYDSAVVSEKRSLSARTWGNAHLSSIGVSAFTAGI